MILKAIAMLLSVLIQNLQNVCLRQNDKRCSLFTLDGSSSGVEKQEKVKTY